jgi:hypothetical protein
MKTHTPGPYPLTVTNVDDFFVIITNQGNHYAKTFDPAAASLISSAPELLAALKSLVDDFERIIGRPIEAEHEAKAAISKATGGAA